MASIVNATIEGRILDTNGPVFAERNGERIQLQVDDPIYESDIIITDENTTTDIVYRDGTKSRVAPNTKFTLTDYEFGPNDDAPSFIMDLAQGAVRTATGEIVKLNPEGFEVITPRATAGIRGTEFINSVDSTTGDETHAVLFISNGSIMLVTDTQGNSLSLNQPLQVTRFSNNSLTSSPVQTISPAQMESVINTIASTIGGDIPQNPAQQGQWTKVAPIVSDDDEKNEQEKQNEQEQQEDQQSQESQEAQTQAESAAEEALANAPENLEQGEAQTILLVVSEEEQGQISDILETLAEEGYEVVVVRPQDANENLNQLIANSHNAFEKPEETTSSSSSSSVSDGVEISFSLYNGGNFTDSTGKMYTNADMAASSENLYLTGFEIIGDAESPTITTGSGNDRITLGASYENGSYNPLEHSYTQYGALSQAYNVSVKEAVINTGSGDDTIYINHNPISPANNQYALDNSEIDMGDGNDALIISKGASESNSPNVYVSTINMGSGNDTVTLNPGIELTASFINLGEGDDVFTTYTDITEGVNLGSGNDTVNQNASTLNVASSGNVTVNANINNSYASTNITNSGNNTINVNSIASDVIKYTATTTSGSDTINFNTEVGINLELNLGDGADYVNFNHNVDSSNITINGGGGNNYISANSSTINSSNITALGTGNFRFDINELSNSTILTDNSGSGSNGSDILYIESIYDSTIETNRGADYVNINSLSASGDGATQINTGASNDYIALGEVIGDNTVYVDAGAEHDVVFYDGTSDNIEITLGAGNDILNISHGTTTDIYNSDNAGTDLFIMNQNLYDGAEAGFEAILTFDNPTEQEIAYNIYSFNELASDAGIKLDNNVIYIKNDDWTDLDNKIQDTENEGMYYIENNNGLRLYFEDGQTITELDSNAFASVTIPNLIV